MSVEQLAFYAAISAAWVASLFIIGGGVLHIIKKPPTPVLDAENLGVILIVCGMVLFAAVAIAFRQYS